MLKLIDYLARDVVDNFGVIIKNWEEITFDQSMENFKETYLEAKNLTSRVSNFPEKYCLKDIDNKDFTIMEKDEELFIDYLEFSKLNRNDTFKPVDVFHPMIAELLKGYFNSELFTTYSNLIEAGSKNYYIFNEETRKNVEDTIMELTHVFELKNLRANEEFLYNLLLMRITISVEQLGTVLIISNLKDYQFFNSNHRFLLEDYKYDSNLKILIPNYIYLNPEILYTRFYHIKDTLKLIKKETTSDINNHAPLTSLRLTPTGIPLYYYKNNSQYFNIPEEAEARFFMLFSHALDVLSKKSPENINNFLDSIPDSEKELMQDWDNKIFYSANLPHTFNLPYRRRSEARIKYDSDLKYILYQELCKKMGMGYPAFEPRSKYISKDPLKINTVLTDIENMSYSKIESPLEDPSGYSYDDIYTFNKRFFEFTRDIAPDSYFIQLSTDSILLEVYRKSKNVPLGMLKIKAVLGINTTDDIETFNVLEFYSHASANKMTFKKNFLKSITFELGKNEDIPKINYYIDPEFQIEPSIEKFNIDPKVDYSQKFFNILRFYKSLHRRINAIQAKIFAIYLKSEGIENFRKFFNLDILSEYPELAKRMFTEAFESISSYNINLLIPRPELGKNVFMKLSHYIDEMVLLEFEDSDYKFKNLGYYTMDGNGRYQPRKSSVYYNTFNPEYVLNFRRAKKLYYKTAVNAYSTGLYFNALPKDLKMLDDKSYGKTIYPEIEFYDSKGLFHLPQNRNKPFLILKKVLDEYDFGIEVEDEDDLGESPIQYLSELGYIDILDFYDYYYKYSPYTVYTILINPFKLKEFPIAKYYQEDKLDSLEEKITLNITRQKSQKYSGISEGKLISEDIFPVRFQYFEETFNYIVENNFDYMYSKLFFIVLGLNFTITDRIINNIFNENLVLEKNYKELFQMINEARKHDSINEIMIEEKVKYYKKCVRFYSDLDEKYKKLIQYCIDFEKKFFENEESNFLMRPNILNKIGVLLETFDIENFEELVVYNGLRFKGSNAIKGLL